MFTRQVIASAVRGCWAAAVLASGTTLAQTTALRFEVCEQLLPMRTEQRPLIIGVAAETGRLEVNAERVAEDAAPALRAAPASIAWCDAPTSPADAAARVGEAFSAFREPRDLPVPAAPVSLDPPVGEAGTRLMLMRGADRTVGGGGSSPLGLALIGLGVPLLGVGAGAAYQLRRS